MSRPISNANQIVMFMHCGRCLAEKPPDVSPRDWGMNEAGWTKIGFQVWCRRHDCNVVHVDFEGKQHPANTHARSDA